MPYYMYGLNFSYMIYLLPGLILGLIAQAKISSAYRNYMEIRSKSGMSGLETARKILDKNGLYDVKIEKVAGQLTDHYDPRDKTVRLSSQVFQSESLAAVSIAAHEVGHAIQDAQDYNFLRFRNSILPLANFGSRFSFILIFIGYVLSLGDGLVKIGIALFAVTVLFQFLTLPVEINASKRALVQLEDVGILDDEEIDASKQVLSAAALTYIASTITAIGSLLRLLAIFGGRDNRR
ncbi:zinc metallopeptidase [Peptoniphilus sp. GNH]|nr:zinc metallopeptidase [Peptoniphilus sp. GNH]